MSEEDRKYFKGLIGFTFDDDDIKYIEKIVEKKDKEIERLNNIIKEAREYIEKAELGEDEEGDTVYLKDDLCGTELLEILDKGE